MSNNNTPDYMISTVQKDLYDTQGNTRANILQYNAQNGEITSQEAKNNTTAKGIAQVLVNRIENLHENEQKVYQYAQGQLTAEEDFREKFNIDRELEKASTNNPNKFMELSRLSSDIKYKATFVATDGSVRGFSLIRLTPENRQYLKGLNPNFNSKFLDDNSNTHIMSFCDDILEEVGSEKRNTQFFPIQLKEHIDEYDHDTCAAIANTFGMHNNLDDKKLGKNVTLSNDASFHLLKNISKSGPKDILPNIIQSGLQNIGTKFANKIWWNKDLRNYMSKNHPEEYQEIYKKTSRIYRIFFRYKPTLQVTKTSTQIQSANCKRSEDKVLDQKTKPPNPTNKTSGPKP